MVMEASPSPQSVGREFVRQYYTLLNKAPAHLHRFYNNYSSFVHGGLDAPNRETLPVIGQKQIHHRIQQLNFRDCHAKISQVDSQATLGNGVVVQVTGELSNGGAPMRRFTQTFVLAAQSPKKYYVHNDIFRYQDIVFSDEEGEASGRSEGEEEDTAGGGYFPPPPVAFPPGAFPAPPPAPLVSPPPAPPVPAAPPAPPHLNGHPTPAPPAPLDDAAQHLVAALHGANISVGGVESEGEAVCAGEMVPVEVEEPEPMGEEPPELELEPEACPHPASPPVSSEPKTYANLLKSGSGATAAGASAPPTLTAAPPAPPAEPRPRPPRAPRDPQPPAERGGGSGGGSARYSDAQQLFLGNLPHSATEESLRALFSRFGAVAELRVHSKPAPPGAPRHPNYGFITYETAHAAHHALNAAPLYFPPDSTDGVKLNVEEKKTRGREPPRRRPLSSHRASFQPRPNYRR